MSTFHDSLAVQDPGERLGLSSLLQHPWVTGHLPAELLEDPEGHRGGAMSRDGWRHTLPVLPMKVSKPVKQQVDDMMAGVEVRGGGGKRARGKRGSQVG